MRSVGSENLVTPYSELPMIPVQDLGVCFLIYNLECTEYSVCSYWVWFERRNQHITLGWTPKVYREDTRLSKSHTIPGAYSVHSVCETTHRRPAK